MSDNGASSAIFLEIIRSEMIKFREEMDRSAQKLREEIKASVRKQMSGEDSQDSDLATIMKIVACLKK